MASVKTVKIDKAAFVDAIKAAGKTLSGLSTEMGHDASYLSQAAAAGALSVSAAIYLEKVAGIQQSAFIAKEGARKPVDAEELAAALKAVLSVDVVSADTMKKAIREAAKDYQVQQAIGQTIRLELMEEATENMIKRIVKEAVVEALQEAF